MRHSCRRLSAAIACSLAMPAFSFADDEVADATPYVYTLGQLTVVTARPAPIDTSDDVVTTEEMWTFNTFTLDEAVKLTPGVMTTLDSNGRRNEHDIFVRGFGRWQVPLSIDGVRIYLPADNRLDFRRFLTADLAAPTGTANTTSTGPPIPR